MNRRRYVLVLAALTAVVVVAAGTAASASASHHSKPARATTAPVTFTVVERGVTDVYVYVNKSHNDVIGNTIGWGNKLYDAKNKKVIGRDQGSCYRTNPGRSWECSWTNMVPGGHITVEGPFRDSGDSVLSITGGTGKYATASGYMVLHARNKAGTAYDFEFHVM
jgi:allene oxide cyclase